MLHSIINIFSEKFILVQNNNLAQALLLLAISRHLTCSMYRNLEM